MICQRCNYTMENLYKAVLRADYWCTRCKIALTEEWLGSEIKETWSDYRARGS